MRFVIRCPECQHRLRLKNELLGKKVKCKCGAVMRLPASLGNQAASGHGPPDDNHAPASADPGQVPGQVLNAMEDDLFGDDLFLNQATTAAPNQPSTPTTVPDPFAAPDPFALPDPNPANDPFAMEPQPGASAPSASSPNSRPPVTPESQPFPYGLNLSDAPTQPAPPAPTYSDPAVHPESHGHPAHPAPPANAPTSPVGPGPYTAGPAPTPQAPYQQTTMPSQGGATPNYPVGYSPHAPAQSSRASRENQVLSQYMQDDSWRDNKEIEGSEGSIFDAAPAAGIGMGILMMIGAIVWFVLGFIAGYIFFYPPVLFLIGLVSCIVGSVKLFVNTD